MLSRLKQALTGATSSLPKGLSTLFGRSTIDQQALDELERILLSADVGSTTTQHLMTAISARPHCATGAELHTALTEDIKSLLAQASYTQKPDVVLLVGINGTGKTTTAAKLAYHAQSQGNKPLLVAADTFRAAAQEQLSAWATHLDLPLVRGTQGQDPASVVYTGCTTFRDDPHDLLIVDTAGRLQSKTNLMKELEKIGSIIAKQLPDRTVSTLIVIDGMLGQNSLEQARQFHECTPLDGIILTKMDGTGKGGICLAIAHELKLPIAYLTYGEQLADLSPFEPDEFSTALLGPSPY